METPFVFGKLAVDQNFTDRREETSFLVAEANSRGLSAFKGRVVTAVGKRKPSKL